MKITNNTLKRDETPWRLYEPEASDRTWCVLWLQGFTSTIERHNDGIIRMAESSNTAFAMLNYAGHGDHPVALEDATQQQQLLEVVDVYDALVQLGYRKIIVVGTSFGGYMAALLAAERPFAALVLRAAANYDDDEFEIVYKNTSEVRGRRVPLYRQDIPSTFTNRAIEGVRQFKGQTYIVEHGADEVINAATLRAYFAAAQRGSYLVIPNLQHSPRTMPNPQAYFELIEFWIAAIVRATKLTDSTML